MVRTETSPPPAPRARGRHYRYYDVLLGAFVTVLLCSNLIGPGKSGILHLPIALPGVGDAVVFGAGNLFFPISYILGDVLTEVYGYARARKAIWVGFGAMLFATVMSQVVIRIPANPTEPFNAVIQPALEVCFGNTWRIAVASIVAFWAGDFVNSFVLAKMKLVTRGRFLWTRTIGSTMAGQAIDSLIFYPIAFSGLWTTTTMIQVVLFNWVFKVGIEVVFTPLTYLVVNALKRAEREDFFDDDTDFTPFSLKD